MSKYHFIFDRIKKNKRLENFFLKKYKNHPPHLCKIIVVLGGDGFMLQALKKYQKYNKIFYGINRLKNSTKKAKLSLNKIVDGLLRILKKYPIDSLDSRESSQISNQVLNPEIIISESFN